MASEYVTTLLLRMQDEATSQWNRFQNDVERGAGRIERQFDKIKTAALGAFSVYTLKGFIDESNKASVAANRLQTALASAGAAGETYQMIKYAEALQKQTTFSHDDIEMADAMLVSFTKLHGTALNPLTKATLDLAEGMHLSAEQAATLIAKSVTGVNALGRYGISIKGATTESEKLQAITEGVEKVFGGAAEAAIKTSEGAWKQFGNSIADVKEKFGDIINELLSRFLPMIRSALDAIEGLPAPIQAAILAAGGLAVAFSALGITMGPVSLGIMAILAAGAGLTALLATLQPDLTQHGELYLSLQADAEKYTASIKSMTAAEKQHQLSILTTQLIELQAQFKSGGTEFNTWKSILSSTLGQVGIGNGNPIFQLTKQGQGLSDRMAILRQEITALKKPLGSELPDASLHAAGSLSYLNEAISKQKKALDDLDPSSRAYISVLAKIQLEQAKLDKQMREATAHAAIQNADWIDRLGFGRLNGVGAQISDVTEQHARLSKSMQQLGGGKLSLPEVNVPNLPDMPWDKPSEYAAIQKYQQAAEMTVHGISSAFGAMLTGKDQDAKQILKSIANSFINMAEAALFAASGLAAAKSIATFWTSMIKDAPLLVAGFGALETARALVNSFHQGGSFFVNAPPSTEVPIMVRGGERGIIQTESQQKHNPIGTGGGGNTYHFNFNAPVSDEEFVKNAVLRTLEKTGKTIDQVYVNKKSLVTVGS